MQSIYENNSLPKRILFLLIGLAITAFGMQAMVVASIGLNPRGILVQGIMHQTNLRYGTVTQILGVVLILISALFRRFPGLGTLCNVGLVGFLIDTYSLLPIWHTPDTLAMQIVLFLTGQVIFSFGMAIYLSQELGSGPRDGIMMLLIQMPHGSVVMARTLLDSFSAVCGYLLGGPVGIGSVLAVALSGVTLKYCFRILRKDPKAFHQENIFETFQFLCKK